MKILSKVLASSLNIRIFLLSAFFALCFVQFTLPLVGQAKKPIWYILYESGILKYRDGLDQEAIYDLERAIDYRPNLPFAHKYLGELYEKRYEYSRATKHFLLAEKHGLRDGDIYFSLGNIYEYQYMLERADTYYSKALALKPDNAKILFRLGRVAGKNNNTQLGQYYFEQIRANDSQSRALLQRARQRYDRGQNEEALRIIIQAVQQNPVSLEAQMFLAKYYRDQLQFDLAWQTYEDILVFEAGNAAIHSQMAHLSYEMGHLDLALKHHRQATTLKPKNHEYWLDFIHLLGQMKRYRERSQVLSQARAHGIDLFME